MPKPTSPHLGLLLVALICFGFAPASQGANVLSDPGFEFCEPGAHTNLPGWHIYGQNNYNEADSAVAHSGTNYFKVYQAFDGAVNFSGVYQDYISGPGTTYSADGWAYADANDLLAGQNVAWIEITFRDA